MATVEFKKEDFKKSDFQDYEIEFHKGDIGLGSNLIVEGKSEDGTYEILQVPIRRADDSIFIQFSEPRDGRLLFED